MADPVILGYVAITPKGEYSPTATYNRLNVVSYLGGSWLLMAESATGIVPAEGETWMQLCKAGDGASVANQVYAYAQAAQGSTPPSTGWQDTPPAITPGSFLWTRVTTTYTDNSSYEVYIPTRYGVDGTGAVSTVNGVAPDASGNVKLTLGSIATVDPSPTPGSQNLVTSGGVYSAVDGVKTFAQPKIASGSVSLPAASWAGPGPWTQNVSVDGALPTSQVNLLPTQAQLTAAMAAGYSVFIINSGGTLTAVAYGVKPAENLSVPCSLVNLSGAAGTISGAPLTGMPPPPRLATLSLPAASWAGSGPWTQNVSISGTTAKSQVNVSATAVLLQQAMDQGFSLTLGNNNGAITAYAVGAKPSTALSVPVTIQEVG